MAYVNVAQWTADQTADWLKGVNKNVATYSSIFLASNIQGEQLLSFRADDLENLKVECIGHQELILEAIAKLRAFHYELDRENLQYLALKLSCVATSLNKELLSQEKSSKVETQTMNDVTHVISMAKPLALWLDRSPFSGQSEYMEIKAELLRLSIEMAASAQRERFAENPLETIKNSCSKLALLADKIIQEIPDPMILQPATLNLVTLKKRENEYGFSILPSSNGIHQVIDIKYGSPAHSNGKIENGDEIVQVNYQTVVGWQPEEVFHLCDESLVDVLLTLKKRPRHTHTYGQIYMKPYRLPSKKRSAPYNRWGSLPSPRPELLKMTRFELPLPKPVVEVSNSNGEGNISSDESETLSLPGTPTNLNCVSSKNRIYLPKPRSIVQRRNTISGGEFRRGDLNISPYALKYGDFVKYVVNDETNPPSDTDDISDNLCWRDKSLSCSTGLEASPRPKTCLGVGLSHSKMNKFDETPNNKNLDMTDVKFSNKSVTFHDQVVNNTSNSKEPSRERGKLDKSHSTPAYDFGEIDDSEYPLIKEIIPESPTSVDSPSIVVHSHQKVEQILEFKKSSEQIGGAMIHQQQAKAKNFDTSSLTLQIGNEMNDSKISNLNVDPPVNSNIQVIEAINIAVLEHKKKKDALLPIGNHQIKPDNLSNVFVTEFGESSTKKTERDRTEHILNIQNELLEVINEQHIIAATNKITETKPLPKLDVPPEPPPRPLSTQKPGYIPPKPRNIQKEDIQVIPNIDITPPILPLRRDTVFPSYNPINPVSPTNLLTPDNKFNTNNLSTSELTLKSPISATQSMQKLDVEQKVTVSVSHSNINKIDSSTVNLKTNTLDGARHPTSPTNSVVRGILSTGKSKSLKKKNSILAKRRKVSVKDLGAGDMQGFLYQRCRIKNNVSVNWRSRWFVLVENTFYGFKNKEATKAECLIFLSGFTVSEAQEVKSKQNAFKIYHTGTAFYFACETADLMNAWVENIKKATYTNNDSWERASKKDKKTEESKHFSETDHSDEEFCNYSPGSPTSPELKSKSSFKNEKSEKSHKFGSLKKFANRIHKSDSHENVSHSSTSLDRKYLRFFSSKYKNKEEKTKLKSGDVPVPTEQYRSYRKMPNTCITASSSSNDQSPPYNSQSIQKDGGSEIISQNIAIIKKIDPIENSSHIKDNDSFSDALLKPFKKSNPIDYVHASNPNLLDFGKSDIVPKIKPNKPLSKNIVPKQDNFANFVTLEQLMLHKQEEERQQVYSNRVLMGIEKKNHEEKIHSSKINREINLQKQLDKIIPDVIYGEIPKSISMKMDQIQNRSLPETPSHKDLPLKKSNFDDSSIVKSLVESNTKFKSSKKKNDGYETIKYDEIVDIKAGNSGNSSNIAKHISPQKFTNEKKDLEKLKLKDTQDLYSKKLNKTPQTKKYEYEFICGDEDLIYNDEKTPNPIKPTKFNAKDFDYETIFDDSSSSKCSSSNNSSIYIAKDKRPVPPPKTSVKPKFPVNRHATNDKKSPTVDSKPVFKQGESPEKFWLDSLRRNDKVYSSKGNENVSSFKSDKFYTKHSEPSTYMKSSEATIVKSDKLQNKALPNEPIKSSDHKQLKSATQYTPMSLPLSSDKALKTSPKFELSLDSRDPPSGFSLSSLRQIFQHSNPSSSKNSPTSPSHSSPKEKTILGSPRLHRAIFRKNQNVSAGDEWVKDFSYSKMSPTSPQSDEIAANETYLFAVPPNNEPVSTATVCDTSNVSNISTPDYSHLEYPPVFEPESYSLANPGPSILKKMNYDQEKN